MRPAPAACLRGRQAAGGSRRLLVLVLLAMALLGLPVPFQPAKASAYQTVLSDELMHGPDLCAHAACAEVVPGATEFSKRKGMPAYVEAYASENGQKRVIGYVFLSTDIVDIPAYSGQPIVTLIGMDTKGIITGVRILKHSEPILLTGIPESALMTFAKQ